MENTWTRCERQVERSFRQWQSSSETQQFRAKEADCLFERVTRYVTLVDALEPTKGMKYQSTSLSCLDANVDVFHTDERHVSGDYQTFLIAVLKFVQSRGSRGKFDQFCAPRIKLGGTIHSLWISIYLARS